jgi:hypothetical protein
VTACGQLQRPTCPASQCRGRGTGISAQRPVRVLNPAVRCGGRAVAARRESRQRLLGGKAVPATTARTARAAERSVPLR